MSDKLSREEVAIMIRARQISRDKSLDPNADVKAICQQVDISRKTGYQWAKKYGGMSEGKEAALSEQLNQLKMKYEAIKKSYDDLRFENEGRKLAWEIHGVDQFLASKKNTMPWQKSRNS